MNRPDEIAERRLRGLLGRSRARQHESVPLLLRPISLSEKRVRLWSLALLGPMECLLVAWLCSATAAVVTEAVVAGNLAVTLSFVLATVLIPGTFALAFLHERGSPETLAGVVLFVCGCLAGSFVSMVAAVFTAFIAPAVVGVALTVILPLYLLDRVRLYRSVA